MELTRRHETKLSFSMSETRSLYITAKHNQVYAPEISLCDMTVSVTQIHPHCSRRRLPLRHDLLETVIVRIPGEQGVHHSQGFLQVEDLIVTTVILDARQSQSRRGRVLEMVADDSQTLIQVLFDRGMNFRNLDAACIAFQKIFSDSSKSRSNCSSTSFSMQICTKLKYDNARVAAYFDACWFKS